MDKTVTKSEVFSLIARGIQEFNIWRISKTFPGELPTRIDLTSSWLPGILLPGADLRNTDFSDSNLAGADLQYATLERADCRNCDLREANLSFTDLRGVLFTDAKLRGVKYFSAIMSPQLLAEIERQNRIHVELRDDEPSA